MPYWRDGVPPVLRPGRLLRATAESWPHREASRQWNVYCRLGYSLIMLGTVGFMKTKNIVAIVLIGILLAAVVFAPVPGGTLGIRTLHDFAHAPIFGCVALLTLFAFASHDKIGRWSMGAQYL